MAARSPTTLRSLTTAVGILAAMVIGLECWLRTVADGSGSVIAAGVEQWQQPLLDPSQTVHHELKAGRTITVHEHSRPARSIRINDFGCRGDATSEVPAEGIYRILLLGDESIFGANVGDAETVGERIRQLLPKATSERIEVINGAVPGDCPLLAKLRFEQRLARLRPELVILHVDMTDVCDDQRYRSFLRGDGEAVVCSHPRFLVAEDRPSAAQSVKSKSAIANAVLSRLQQSGSLWPSNPQLSVRQRPLGWISDDGFELHLAVRHALEPIAGLGDAVRGIGARLLVTTCPVRWQVVETDGQAALSVAMGVTGKTPLESELPFETLTQFCELHKLRFLNTTPAFRSVKEPERMFDDSSPGLSMAGMALYAREVARYLKENPPSRW